MLTALPTILLVDDDKISRRILRRMLQTLSIQGQVLEAKNGAQALELVEAYCSAVNSPQSLLVLLDINMPVMDGVEFLERHVALPQAPEKVAAVVVVSASSSAAEQERARSLATEVKSKPLAMAELAALVQRYLPAALPA